MDSSFSDHDAEAPLPGGSASSDSLPVVGLGASAGGLKALQQFFLHMPANSGMVFVVILHLSPEYESNLAALLQATTTMPVTQVNEPVRVERDHVYVISPTKHLSMTDGALELTDPERVHGRQVVIDLFFRTLAETYGMSAAAIILSGTGSDGTSGLKRIKEFGGVTFAQDPQDAEYDGMPRSAIATGLVDYVLPAAAMPEQLIAYRRNEAHVRLPDIEQPGPGADFDALRDIFGLLRMRTGHDFTSYKRTTMPRRIGRRMQVNGTIDLPSYHTALRTRSGEAEALLRDLLISVTNFFRDQEVFDALEAALPQLFADKTTGDQLRAWVAGCATGEEAYSLAMLLREHAEQLDHPPELQIFATDIDEDALVVAREGLYANTITADVSPERLQRFFSPEQSGYRIGKEVRDIVLFAAHNLLRDPPFSKLDLISCRNLLIYLDRTVQEQLLKLFHFVLRPDGILLLGASEFADGVPELFMPIDKQRRLFVRRAVTRTTPELPSLPLTAPVRPHAPETKLVGAQQAISFGELHLRLLEQYAPPSVVVNEAYDIVHLSEHAGQFLQLSGGEPSYNLLKVVHPDLRIELRSALFRATQKNRSSQVYNIPMHIDGAAHMINLAVRPAHAIQPAQGFVLVIFDEAGVVAEPGSARAAEDIEPVADQLDQELQHTRNQLRSTIEQYETSIEELKASNEELQAINEELRSTTEELETSKEELHSINEELRAVNQELKIKIDELSRVNSDFQNFLAATNISTLFLDRTLRLMRNTPRSEELFNLIPSDINRPLAHITNRLNYATLTEDATHVLKHLTLIEREVQRDDGRWYIARMVPYRTTDDRLDGVVLTFVDITERKLADRAQLESRRQTALILESIDDAYISIDSEWRCLYMNRAHEQLLGLPRSAALGKDIRQVYAAIDIVPFFEQLQRAFDERAVLTFETYYQSLGVWADVRVLPTDDGGLTIYQRDISATHQAQERLRISEERLRLLNENVSDYAMMMMDVKGRVVDWNIGAERMFGYRAAEMLGQDTSRIFTPEDIAADVPERELGIALATGRAEDERWHIRKDGSRFWVSGVMMTLRDADGQLRGFAKVARDMTERRAADEALQHAHSSLERRVHERTHELAEANDALQGEMAERKAAETARTEVARRLVQVEEEERTRISRELHDQIGQQLTALMLGLQSLKSVTSRQAALPVIEQTQQIADAIGEEVHQLALRLRPTALDDMGLATALENYATDWGQRTQVEVAFHSRGLEERPPAPPIESTIYRVVLEALNNVARHAQARHVGIILERRDADVLAIVEDDGRGFDSDAVLSTLRTNRRLGLLGMQERVTQVGGMLTIEATPGKGTTVIIRLPLGERVEELADE